MTEVNLSNAREALRQLSGRYGNFVSNPHGYLVSNDKNIHDVLPRLREGASHRSGMALFIGQGAVFSLMPHLEVQLPVVVDINPVVTKFAGLTQLAISTNSRPSEAIEQIVDTVNSGWLEQQTPRNYGGYVRSLLEAERRNFEGIHWSQSENFEAVREVVTSTPVETVVADITNEEFLGAFREVQSQYKLPLTFANITNVTEYMAANTGEVETRFIAKLGLAERAMALFSSVQGISTDAYPSFRLAQGADNLRDATGMLAKEVGGYAAGKSYRHVPRQLFFLDESVRQ